MKKIIPIIIVVSLLAVSVSGLTINYEAGQRKINSNKEILTITNTREDASNFFSFEGKEYYLPPFPAKTQKQLDKMIKDPKPSMTVGDLPSQFSWLDYGGDWSTTAKNQGSCGSCWAFGALGAMESAINIAKGDPNFDRDLSEQYLLSCLPAAGSCSGGWMSDAIQYIKDTGSQGNGINGCPLESCMAYTATDYFPCTGKCPDWNAYSVPPEADDILFQVEDFGVTQLSPSNPDDWNLLKTWIITYGPVVVDIVATNGWSSYWSTHHSPTDWYYEAAGGYTNHAQVCYGWVDNSSVTNGGYWILKNSWGTNFGYGGFNNLAYGGLLIGDRDVTWVTTPNWSDLPNGAPAEPSIPDPAPGATDVDTNPTLGVYVEDPDNDVMNVAFYEAGSNILIDTAYGIASGSYASIVWTGLDYETLYSWYAVASDGEYTNTSPIWNFTTGEPQPEKFYATQDIPVKNGGIIGSYVDTQISDGNYMRIQERESGGKPSNRYSYLEHKWIIHVAGGLQYYEFALEANHTVNSEGDDFVFAYSLDDVSYTNMMIVTKTADDDSYQLCVLPDTISGNVYIRVRDMDQSQGNSSLDSILIDYMHIEGTGTLPPNRAPAKPSGPNPADGATNVDTNPTLSVYVQDPDNNVMNVTFYEAGSNILIDTAYGIASGSYASIVWTGLDYETFYSWYAVANDSEYTNTSSIWNFTTRSNIPPTDMYLSNISWSEKSAGKNIFLSHTVTVMSAEGVVIGATVYSTLTNLNTGETSTFSGLTDATGKVSFEKKCKPGNYEAFVTDIVHTTYDYNSDLDIDNPSYHDVILI
jgi:hypothetical protein